MCNRYRMSAKQAEVARACGFDLPYMPDETYPPPAEIFPKRPAYVVRDEAGQRTIDTMQWGFPHTITGASGKRIEKQVTNVRNYASPFWRSALKNPAQRCLVPFTSFSEYGAGMKGDLPLYWFDVPSRPVACFAGVWRRGENGPLYAFLTCGYSGTDDLDVEKAAAAAHIVGRVHSKATPVILHPEDYDRWLRAPIEDVLPLATPYPSQLMRVSEPEYPARKPV
jgi:putative SOS response-associated peptidase YedK